MSKPLNIQIVERARSLIEKEEHWCFDLLSIDGARITPLPLHQRKAMLAKLVAAVGDEHLQFSGAFSDPIKLLATCQRMNLEGIVSKRRNSAYRSGPTRDWLKIKTASWRAANRDRRDFSRSDVKFVALATAATSRTKRPPSRTRPFQAAIDRSR